MLRGGGTLRRITEKCGTQVGSGASVKKSQVWDDGQKTLSSEGLLPNATITGR